MVGGAGGWEGRVEVYCGGSWGTVCDDSWSSENANVICRMLGYEGVQETGVFDGRTGRFGAGSGDINLDDVQCIGTEESIFDCNHRGCKTHNCGHGEDIGIICTRK